MSEIYENKVDGLYISGKLPDEWSKTILFVHGGGLNYKSGLPVVDYFANEGFATFTMSLRGHTGSDELSDRFELTTLDDYKEDIETVINHLNSKYATETKDIFVIAHSLGALPALKAAYKSLGGLVLLAPVLTKEVHENYKGDLTKLYKAPSEPDLTEKRLDVADLSQPEEVSQFFLNWFFGRPVDLAEYKDLLSREPQNTRCQAFLDGYSIEPEKMKSPLMVLVGKKDSLIAEEGAKALASLYCTDSIRYYAIDSSHMIMFDEQWATAAGRILEFIQQESK